MSHWQELEIAQKIRAILADVQYTKPEHHFGRPFLTAYQLALEFARRYPEDFATIGQPIGGEGVGQQSSLAQYIARQLSTEIRDGNTPDIEGGFISNLHLREIAFREGDRDVVSSLTSTQFDLSMFRLSG